MKIKDFAAARNVREIVLLGSLAGALLFSQVSISIVQIFLGFALAAWAVLLVRRERRFAVPAFFWPLLVYAGLSLLSSALSFSPVTSFRDARELLLFLIVPMVFTAFTRAEESEWMLAALAGSGFINVFYSIGYQLLEAVPGERVKGFMGHYMTQAGLLVLFASVALGFIVFRRGRSRLVWTAGFVLASYALVLTLTRSGWIGLGIAATVIVLLWKPKVVILLPVLAALFIFVSPRTVRDRALSIFSLKDPTNQYRFEYARAGVRIIADYPIFGTGPNTVQTVFQNPKYGLSEIARRNVHLHSNLMQIAAERGLPALAAWLAFVVRAFLALLRRAGPRGGAGRPIAAGALAALAAFFVAGLFEFNFGDSEISTLLLFILTLPFARPESR